MEAAQEVAAQLVWLQRRTGDEFPQQESAYERTQEAESVVDGAARAFAQFALHDGP
jgi:hypothetical protein